MEERIFDAADAALADAIAFIEEGLEKANASPKLVIELTIALEEIFVNVAHYAYPGSEGKVAIGFDDNGEEITIRFSDRGIQFDPLAKPDPDITLSAEERDIGGLGILMVKKSMDNVYYEYKDNQNILTLVKKLR